MLRRTPELQSCQISHEISHWQDRARFWSVSCEIFVRVVRIESCEISHELSYIPMRMLQVFAGIVRVREILGRTPESCEISH